MNAVRLRGACPGLSAPMQTGDGLIVRLRPAAPIALEAMAGFCEAARRHGNGTIEVSGRGSLQVRGLTHRSAPVFASVVAELGIAAQDGVPVITGFDEADLSSGTNGNGVAQVAADLRRAIANAELTLSAKVSVVVDGGGGLHLDALTSDVRLRAAQPAGRPRFGGLRFYLGLGGDGASAVWLGTVGDAVPAVVGLLRIIAAHGPAARAAEILRTEGVAAFACVAACIEPAPAPPQRIPAEVIGLHAGLDGTISAGIGLAFGHTHADALAEILSLAARRGARAVSPLPDRALLLIGTSVAGAREITVAAQQLGFVVQADDPRRRIAACPGAPACLSGLIPARALASALAPLLGSMGPGSCGDRPLAGGESTGWSTQVPSAATPEASPQGGMERFAALVRRELAGTAVEPVIGQRRDIALHISGCAKGCAHPSPAPLTLVGTPHGCGVVHHGCADRAPRHYLNPANPERRHSAARNTKRERQPMAEPYLRDGTAIYRRSFAIIRAEADLARFSDAEAEVAIRMIHACGFVEAAKHFLFARDLVATARAALARGAPVLCDTEMVAHGITQTRLPAGNEVFCALRDPSVPARAQKLGTTRCAAALELWGDKLSGAVVAIGNAPTALFRLLELLNAGAPRPAAILGIPVGFVGAAESKEALAANAHRVPFLIVRGRMGGSAMTAAAVNALAKAGI